MENSDEINSIESEEHTHRLNELTSTLQRTHQRIKKLQK